MARRIEVQGEIARVPLRKDGSVFALVDSKLIETLHPWTWSLHPCGRGKHYARAVRHPDTGEFARIYMHRYLAQLHLPAPARAGMVVDHINGNSLDNRLCNLRWLEAAANRWMHAKHGQMKGVDACLLELSTLVDLNHDHAIPF